MSDNKKPLYQVLARLVTARLNCLKDATKADWKDRHEDRILALVKNHMPSGAGVDNGTSIDLDKSTPDKLVFDTAYHHMTEGGYDGWTDHTVTVKADLADGFKMTIGGRNRNEIKDYLHDTYYWALRAPVQEYDKAAPSEEPPAPVDVMT